MTRGVAVVLMIAATVSACAIGDPYQRPDTRTPPAWIGDGAAAAWPAPDWWRGFGSAQLDGLIQQAAAGNFDLAVAIAKVRQAEAAVRIAGGALVPSVTASGDATRERASMSSSSSSSRAKPVYYSSYGASLGVSYELDFWGKNAATVDAAAAAAEASRFDHQTAMTTMQAGIATTYFDILGLGERLRLARESVRNAEEVLAAYRDRLAVGTATSLDVAQQESVVAGQRAAVPTLEQQLQQSRNALAILLGRLPDELGLEAETMDQVAVPAVAAGLPSQLLARRPDVQSAEASLRAANADITVARAAWFPSISLTGQGGFQSLDLAKMMTHQSLLFSIGPSLSVPIFDGGTIAGTVVQKRARWDELAQTYRKTVATAFQEVEDALIGLQKSGEEEQAQREAEATARRAYGIARDLMAAGTVDITSVLNTQKTWFTAQDSLAQAQLAHLRAAVTLYKVMGGGWETDGAVAPSGR